MTRFIIFVFLLLFTVHLDATETIKIIGEIGERVELKIESIKNISKCILVTNQNVMLEYPPKSGKIREDIHNSDFIKTCSVDIIKVNNTHAGVWKITAIGNDNIRGDIEQKVIVFNVYITEGKPALTSKKHIRVYEGYFISMKHQQIYKNLVACNLTGPEMEPINLLENKQEDFELFGQCGVRMKVNASYSGMWSIDAVMSEFVFYYISFSLDVQQIKQQNPDKMEILQWVHGSRGIINFQGNAKICQIFDPSGRIVTTSYGRCTYEVNVATVQHEGVWLMRYNMDGMLEAVDQKVKIKIKHEKVFNTGIDYINDNRIRLFCQIEFYNRNSLTLCNLIRPDNKIFYIMPAISTDRYTAYLNSSESFNYTFHKCGLTIHQPEDIDYGAWQCEIKIGYPSKLYGSIIHFEPANYHKYNNVNVISRKSSKIKVEDVYVKHGDQFTIKCNAEYALAYCWLRSPNGTSYSIKQNTQNEHVKSPFVLPYTGKGLTFGECQVKISAAEYSDHGKWNCFMGRINGTEKAMEVSVTVTESYLVAEQKEIAVKIRNDPVLSCRIIPRMLDRTVHYCRWIRPDGYGIYNDISHRYTTNSSYTLCRLVILNYSPKVDNGIWTCVAGLIGQEDMPEENRSHIAVRQALDIIETSAIIGIIIGSILLLLATIGTFGYIAVRKRRMLTPVDPPDYCSHKVAPSESLDYKFDTSKS